MIFSSPSFPSSARTLPRTRGRIRLLLILVPMAFKAELPASPPASPPDDFATSELHETHDFRMMGWATVGSGTTGGAGGSTVTVATAEGLVAHIGRREPLTIRVEGTIDLGTVFPGFKENGSYSVASNKTIIGVGADAGIRRGEFLLSGVSNVIIRNLTFSAAPDTAISISNGSNRVWIDHNHLGDAQDGALDITQEADFVTVSWNVFSNHFKVSLVGAGDDQTEDRGKLRVTYHHNWFSGTIERHPRVRFGRVHVFSNYYDKVNRGIGIGVEAQIVSEDNFFDTSTPFIIMFGNKTAARGFLRDTGSYFTAGDLPQLDDSGISWSPNFYYDYTRTNPFDVPYIVTSGAGVGVVEGPAPPPPPPPVGLVALFPLTEGGGTTATDQSGFDETIRLTLSGGATWLPGRGGVWLDGGAAKLQSEGPVPKLAGRITRTNQFTVEVWAKAAVLNQEGPARLVSYSVDTDRRNFSVAHGMQGSHNSDLLTRVRNTGRSDENGLPSVIAPAAAIREVAHIVSTFDGQTIRLYRNGELILSEAREGRLDYWDWEYPLILGNERTNDRGWRGELYSAAIFDRALAGTEVRERYLNDQTTYEIGEIASFGDWFVQLLPEIDATDPAAGGVGGDAYEQGVPNLLRYALGLHPREPDRTGALDASLWVDPVNGERYLILVFHRRKPLPDVEVVVEVSDDLLSWTPLGADAVIETLGEGDLERVTVRDEEPISGESGRFGRLRVIFLGQD